MTARRSTALPPHAASTTRSRRSRTARTVSPVLALAAVGVLGAVFAVPAGAAPSRDFDERGRVFQPPTPFSQSYSFDPGCPGISLNISGTNSGVETILVAPGTHGQAFYDIQHYTVDQKITNTANGKYVTNTADSVYSEHDAQFVPNRRVPTDLVPPGGLVGPVYRFTATDVGVQAWFKDSNGNTIMKDQGIIVSRPLLDTLGDHQPGGVTLESPIVKVIGPHPSLNSDACALALQYLG